MTRYDGIRGTIGHGSRVQQFYAGQSVFVTGGTGFLGKLLLEKLLRTCRDVKAVYVMVRPKKGEDSTERLERLFEDSVFDRLKKQVPDYQKKVQVISGDCTKPGMGLSASDVGTLLEQTNIVFNIAATVRFNEKLKQAIITNVYGVHGLLKLCSKMQNLRAVMHVSTAFSNCIHQEIGERFYTPPITAEEALELLKRSDNEIDNFEKSILNTFPNTYIYTKCIAESLVQEYGKKLPIGVFRPAVVLSTLTEPIPGWVDAFQGPSLAVAGIGSGLLRTFPMNQRHRVEIIPADYSINLLMTTAWAIGTEGRPGDEPKIYNYVSSCCGSTITWKNFIYFAGFTGKKIRNVQGSWFCKFSFTNCQYFYFLMQILLHFFPALLIDGASMLLGGKPKVLKVYKKMHMYAGYMKFFTTREWDYNCDNTMSLWRRLEDGDRVLFPFSMESFDWYNYMDTYVYSIEHYLMKDDPRFQTSRMLKIMLSVIRYVLLLALLYPIYSVVHHVFPTCMTIGV